MMNTQSTVQLTYPDFDRLNYLVESVMFSSGTRASAVAGLMRNLTLATKVDSKEIPPDVVTMNSKILVYDLIDDEQREMKVVYPESSNPATNSYSVLAPVGQAVLGRSVGDVVEYSTPAGIGRLRIDAMVYQPEAAGDWGV